MKNEKYKIAISLPVEERHKEKFLELCTLGDVTFFSGSIPDDNLSEFDIIFGNPHRKSLSNATSLKLLQLCTAGSDIYSDKNLFPNKDIVLSNCSGAFGLSIAETMVGLHLSLIKNLHLYRDNQNNSLWKSEGKSTSINGSTVLCVGIGDLGSNYAKRIKSLGAYVIGVRRTVSEKPDFLDEVYLQDDISDIIGRADVVALCLPNTEKTNHFLNKSLLQKMKKTAYIINVGRGSAIDTDALYYMLENNLLAGAALDVVDIEPLPPTHKLWSLKNIIITPHITGTFNLEYTHDLTIDIGIQNIKNFILGESLLKTVNFEEKY